MWKIGNVEINNQVVLAPMAGICNNAFRRIIKEQGCGLIYAEMVSDKAVAYKNDKTLNMLYMTEEERPIVQQIFGSDKESFVKAAKTVYETMKPDIIDINMGCPVPKVAVKSQAGAALLKDPQKIKEIVEAVVNSVPIPVTVKMRSGWDKNSINAVEVAKIVEKAGAKAICIHPRTRSEGYSGKADWNIIKAVKESVSIPVIGNGDIKTVIDAKNMLEMTGCNAIMIGRGCLGNPHLIKQLVAYLKDKTIIPDLNYIQKLDICIKHFQYLLEIKNENVAVKEIRSHALWYLKGFPNNADIKNKITSAKTKEEFLNIIESYKPELRKEDENES